MEAILNSFLVVALTEMGDKTQLLAFVLACRFKKPWTIFSGIFVATILNHALAAAAGGWASKAIPEIYLKWILALSFFAFAIWVLIPDKPEALSAYNKHGAFLTTVIAFFIAEMGDKTQLSTIAMAAKYNDIILVTIGTTLGMMFSNGLAVFFGERLTRKISMKWLHITASLMFAAFGVAILIY